MARPRKSKVKTSVYESDEIKAIAEGGGDAGSGREADRRAGGAR
jgi:hypothetical protein